MGINAIVHMDTRENIALLIGTDSIFWIFFQGWGTGFNGFLFVTLKMNNIEFGKVSTMEKDTVKTVLVMAHVSAQGSIGNSNVNVMTDT